MVAGQLSDRVTPCEIEATVAGPDAGIVILGNEKDRHGGSNDAAAALPADLENPAVGEVDSLFGLLEEPNRRAFWGYRVEGLDDQLAGDVSRFVPSHAVRHGPETGIRPHQKRIL